jgi:beta-glucosidase-like glycosyl hydrolase/CubicO group peptidase (beta-lactamase class C family)
MSLEQKAAQMVMVRALGQYRHPDSDEYRELLGYVRDLGVGGVVIFDADLESIPRLIDELQKAAGLPLLVAADLERGLAFRVRRGPVQLPYAMAVGATRSPPAARFLGEVTAREGLALGIHWAFAPVADVNNNPENPIINLRSFGEDPELVAELAAAFIAGARSQGMLTTAKHFPGHGDTAIDSHQALPVLDVDRARLEAVELRPFRAAVTAGVDAIMLGHIAVPALDPSGAPATLSPILAGGLLRDGLGFRGLIVTDAVEMEGLRSAAWTGAAAVRAVRAGADVVLLPREPRVAVQSLVRGVREGQLDEDRLDASVERILSAKARLGLHRRRSVDPAALRRVGRPEDVARAREVAAAAITVVRNDGGVLPLAAERPLRLLHLVMSSGFYNRSLRGLPQEELAERRIEVETLGFGPEVTAATAGEIVAAAPGYTHVLVSASIRAGGELSPSQAGLLRRLAAAGPPVIVVSFGSPYVLAQVPEVQAYVCAFGPAESSQRGLVAALLGEVEVGGRLPVTLPGLYPYGHGIEIPRREMTLRDARPEEAGFRPGAMKEVDRVLDRFVGEGAFPGGVVAVGHRGALVHLKPFGRLSYDEDAAAVRADTIYDLASLTKVVATTTMAMILVGEDRLDLDAPVQDFLPLFVGPGKETVTVRHLLTHSSGIDWWAPLYEELRGHEAYVERIQAMDLVYEPGSQSKYSDLGLILLGEILERLAGEPLDAFVRRRVFEPLGMADTLFRPGADLVARIAPTERDEWRGRLVRGEVHDENAFALGGVAPHAGLFSAAPDLSRFAQMILNGGVFEHRRIVPRWVVREFTRRAGVPESTRALGWDTKSAEGSSAGTLFSPSSFGHTGFTGTSIWIDPERELFVILLTNRVHPTRENILIRQARPAVADAVVRGLVEP